MEDISSKITELLNNPEVINKIKSFVNNSSANKDETENEGEKKEGRAEKAVKKEESGSFPFALEGVSPDVLNMLMKIAPIISSINEDSDKYSSFLSSLRPLLSEKRQKKLDESFKIMKLIKIFPILKNNGII